MKILHVVYNYIRAVWRAYWQDECLILSAAISFYVICSIIPFIFLVFMIWGSILASPEALYQQLVELARSLFPELSMQVLEDLHAVVRYRRALGWVGIVFLFWVFDVAFYSIAHAFDRIFGVARKRRYYRVKILSVTALLFVGVVLYLSVKVAMLSAEIRHYEVMVLGYDISTYLSRGLSLKYLVYFLQLFIVTVLFLVVPTVSVRPIRAFGGGLLAVSLWFVAKMAFQWYVENIAVFNVIYGTLGTLIVVVIWIFYSANILLICAECVAVMELQERKHLALKESFAEFLK